MMQHHSWSLTEIEDMIPWEREIYIGMLLKFLKDERERAEKEKSRYKQLKRESGAMAQKKLEKGSQY